MSDEHTQRFPDDELCYIIHNGIRWTGMPAWGDENNDQDSWKLVLFAHHLPHLTQDEIRDVEHFNPRSVAELEEEKQEDEFLNGGTPFAPRIPKTEIKVGTRVVIHAHKHQDSLHALEVKIGASTAQHPSGHQEDMI